MTAWACRGSPLMPPMRATVISAFVAVLAVAGTARADKLMFSGTHAIKFSQNGVIKEVGASGTGVAYANGKAGPLSVLALTRDFAKITTTVTSTPGLGIDAIRFKGVRINPKIAGPGGSPGVFAPILTAAKGMTLTRRTLPAAGTIGICNLLGCPGSVPVKLDQTVAGVAVGPGVGGTVTAMGMTGPTKVTVMGN